tara:strand:- start:289 stop:507 length:219 start_codon:yes stop_codon:yes gene_type:complete
MDPLYVFFYKATKKRPILGYAFFVLMIIFFGGFSLMFYHMNIFILMYVCLFFCVGYFLMIFISVYKRSYSKK